MTTRGLANCQPSFLLGATRLKRVAVFIDGSNLYHTWLSFWGMRGWTSANSLRSWRSATSYRTYYYNAQLNQQADPEAYRAQQRFLSSLRALPFFELRLGVLKPRGNTWVEKGIDVKVAVDMIGMAYKNQYDVALLVSGDGDYVDCVRAVKDAGRHVVNAYFVSSQSLALRDACDNWICMDKDYLVDVLK